ncbi:hypothetical protein M404DRAFT_36837 [Pisolithus tinctorius Marx 270]|uniref:Reverse transcriptase domain-containing protein n=1 Tax=Pisolithus tinctorius Marx 270 TaxID=870435 RepID=A0A0C3I646_PISTI|nr:hypothetical protein M404DRAFT_36837 [Pisolithus tinctorius Marx 270]
MPPVDPFDTSSISLTDPFLFSTTTTISPLTISALCSTYQFNPIYHVLKYKPVARKVRPVPTSMPAEFQVEHREAEDPLADLPVLPTHPPLFMPGSFGLWKLDLVQWLVREQEDAFAWDALERGTFREDMFPPLKIPTLAHKPWIKWNIPIPLAIFREVVNIIKEKISAGVYEPSTSSYCSKWFCIVKKDRKSLCLIHDLQPLNAISIQDSAIPPFIDSIAEALTCHSVYRILDLMVLFDSPNFLWAT